MRTFKNYSAPELEIVLITDDVVRTSIGGDEGETPLQPWTGF